MLTMRPLRRARISSTANRLARMVATSETSMTNRHVSSVEAWNSLARSRALCPTLLKRMSMRPKRWRMAAKAARTASPSVQSAVIGSTCRPIASMSRATSCSVSPSRSTTTRSAPSRARRSALARPMPLAAPVTTAMRSASRLSTRRAMVFPRWMRSDEAMEPDPALGDREAEAGEHDEHGGDGGDGRIHAVLDGGEDLHGQRHLARPQEKDGDGDVVERHDEGEERPGRHARADERERDGEEG